MILSLQHGKLYLDNFVFSLAEVLDGRGNLPVGRHKVEARYSHKHERVLPHVDAVGWIGFDTPCAVVLGKVRVGGGIIPCSDLVERLLACIRIETEADRPILMEITHG